MLVFRLACLSVFLLLAACSSEQNDPYPLSERGKNIYYAAFTERPKHLDPVQSYTEDEITFTAQIYEPLLQYHYLKRPYTLIPATAEAVPVPRYYDAGGKALPVRQPVTSHTVSTRSASVPVSTISRIPLSRLIRTASRSMRTLTRPSWRTLKPSPISRAPERAN